MVAIHAVIDGVIKLFNIHFDVLGHSLSFMEIAVFTFVLNLAVWVIGGILK